MDDAAAVPHRRGGTAPDPALAELLSVFVLREHEIAESLADAVVEAVPQRWAAVVDAQCRPLTHRMFLPALTSVVEGGRIPAHLLDDVAASAAVYPVHHVPVAAVVRGVHAALWRFSVIAHDEARAGGTCSSARLLGLAMLLPRASLVIGEVLEALLVGHQAEPRPDRTIAYPWWARTTPLARSALRLAAEGMTNAQIAGRLRCSTQTVNYHLRTFMDRLGCCNRTAMAVRAHEAGLLAPDA